jgi:phenylpropionate dioxygenase-like ring-hydroxylating dioxygenase large terminal subunit
VAAVERRPKEPEVSNAWGRNVTLANFWHPVAASEDVTAQPRAFRLLGDPIVMFRHSGGVAAFEDLCIHRGTALSLGSINDGLLTCAYHGWQYDLTGNCVHIPSLPEGASIPKKARAIPHRAEERFGLVWVAVGDPVQPIPEWPDNCYDLPGWRSILVGHYVFKTSAGRVCENAMDFSHFNFTHKGYLELSTPKISPHEVHRTDFGLTYTYLDGPVRREYSVHAPFTVFIKMDYVGELSGSGDADMPWMTTPQAGGTVIVSVIASPRDETTSDVYTHIGCNFSHDQMDSWVAPTHEVLEQDRKIVESQRPERIPVDLREELHLKVPDATGIAYRRMLNEIDQISPFMP